MTGKRGVGANAGALCQHARQRTSLREVTEHAVLAEREPHDARVMR